jgi:hypothetical protein
MGVGVWGELVFDNDTANEWAYQLDGVRDLSLVEAALAEVENVGDAYLDAELACSALAACEVLARLLGNFGYRSSYTANVDAWVASHPRKPGRALLDRAASAIRRVASGKSELREHWAAAHAEASWRDAVEDLQKRLTP